MYIKLLYLSLLISIICYDSQSAPAPLTARQVGQYAGKAWVSSDQSPVAGTWQDRTNGLRFTVRSINVNADDPNNWPDLSDFRQEVYDGMNYSPQRTVLPRIHFWDGADRYTLPMRDISVYKARLDYACSEIEPVMDLIHGICLSEENVPYDGHIDVLEELYWHVKNQYPDLKIYQWWTPNTSTPDWYYGVYLSADGWIFDPYTFCVEMYPPTDSRYSYFKPNPYLWLIRRYYITGKPLIPMQNASASSFREWYDISTTPYPPAIMWDIVEYQRNINKAFNLPTSYYWSWEGTTYFPLVTGDELQDEITQDVRNHCWEAMWIPTTWKGDASITDYWDNSPAQIQSATSPYYSDDFSRVSFLEVTSGSGFRDLIHNGYDLRTRGFEGRDVNVVINYNFSGSSMVYPKVSLDVNIGQQLNGSVKLSASKDGVNYPVAVESSGVNGAVTLTLQTGSDINFAQVSNFFLKIELLGASGNFDTPAVRIDNLLMTQGSQIEGCGSWGFKKTDINNDCYIDYLDLTELLSQWLQCTNPQDSADCVNLLQ